MGKKNKSDNGNNCINRNGELRIKEKFELTEKQKQILEIGLDKNCRCLILDGKAGTSKTYLAILIALKLIGCKKANNLSYIRTSVQSKDGELGFMPGNAEEKTAWMNEPFFEKLDELLTKPDVQNLVKEDKLKTFPSSMLRGVNLNGVAVMDECQNALIGTLETVMTRMTEHSLLILCGDSSGAQNDLGSKTGFKQLVEMFNNEDAIKMGICLVNLGKEDVVRSKLTRFVVETFEKYRANNIL